MRKETEQPQVVVMILALCFLCMMMSFGMTLPIFAHLFQKTSSGVVLLSVMVLIPQMTIFVLAPLAGNLADRYGRYPLLILASTGLVAANIGDIFAHTPLAYIGIQIFQSIVCVGARPAMMGILADMAPEQQRTRHLSLVMAGCAGGLTLGPVCGGFLLQRWGVIAPFGLAACLNFVMLCLICAMILRTPVRRLPQQKGHWQNFQRSASPSVGNLRRSLVLPLTCFVGLLVLDFILAFGRTFIEPQLVAYITKVLRFSPVQLGLLLSSYGLAMSIGALASSRLDKHIGKQITVAGGFLAQTLFPLSLLFTHQFPLLLLAALLSGTGGGLVLPLLGACYLASVKADQQARISGIKEAVGAFGGIVGTLPVLLASRWLHPHIIFMLGACTIAGGGFFSMGVLKASGTFLVAPMAPASRVLPPVPHSTGVKQVATE